MAAYSTSATSITATRATNYATTASATIATTMSATFYDCDCSWLLPFVTTWESDEPRFRLLMTATSNTWDYLELQWWLNATLTATCVNKYFRLGPQLLVTLTLKVWHYHCDYMVLPWKQIFWEIHCNLLQFIPFWTIFNWDLKNFFGFIPN